MSIPNEHPETKEMRERYNSGDEDFKINSFTTAFFNPESAKLANKKNFSDLTLSNSLFDSMLFRKSKSISWLTVRDAWNRVINDFNSEINLQSIYSEMKSVALSETGCYVDLNKLIHKCISFPLIDVMIFDLNQKEKNILESHIAYQVEILTRKTKFSKSFKIKTTIANLKVASIIRKSIRKRLKGDSFEKKDLLGALIPLYSELGMERTLDAMMTIITAISGPPGGVAVCAIAELLSDQSWQKLLKNDIEMCNTGVGVLPKLPFKNTPFLHNFIKESLRMWSVPVVVREVRCPLSIGGIKADVDDTFLSSMYFIHRSEKYWENANTFLPQRWLGVKVKPGTYVPFGWQPRTCIGSILGTNQLSLIIYMFLYDIEFSELDTEGLAFENINIPEVLGFKGKINVKGAT